MNNNSLTDFVESVCGDSHLRVEQDFGGGFVRLRSSEAEKRQAAQDIRSTEDILIELLRNSRDAGARRIFLALSRDENTRIITIIDDGDGIPIDMHQRIFEPRVTSKLETAHMDKWGMHGRGMALYSVSENATSASVRCSEPQCGTSIQVVTDLSQLGEKRDQSTFPRFELIDGSFAMRGPKNAVRTSAEFALDSRNLVDVFFGTPVEIAATLYEYAMSITSPAMRAFTDELSGIPLTQRLAFSADPGSFAQIASSLGLDLSARSARRIINGSIAGVPSLMERLESESFPEQRTAKQSDRQTVRTRSDARGLKIQQNDLQQFSQGILQAFADIASSYYLNNQVTPDIRVTPDAIKITIPVDKLQ